MRFFVSILILLSVLIDSVEAKRGNSGKDHTRWGKPVKLKRVIVR